MSKIIILDVSQAQSKQAYSDFGSLRVVFSDVESSEVFRNYVYSKYNLDIYISKRTTTAHQDKGYYWFCEKWFSSYGTGTLQTIFDKVHCIDVDYKNGYTDGVGYMDWLFDSEHCKIFLED